MVIYEFVSIFSAFSFEVIGNENIWVSCSLNLLSPGVTIANIEMGADIDWKVWIV